MAELSSEDRRSFPILISTLQNCQAMVVIQAVAISIPTTDIAVTREANVDARIVDMNWLQR